jgi:Methyltransferase domain
VGSTERATHWDDAYRSRGFDSVSWYQSEPTTSLELIRSLGVDPAVPVVDVGGGASPLVDRLLELGYGDVSVLDLSEVALEEARRRVGPGAPVCWLRQDVLEWRPTRRYGLWHDRAVFHFLVDDMDRARYLETLAGSTAQGGAVVIATFADDGPERCSGLPVARYSEDDLIGLLGDRFVPAETRRETHFTPAGTGQPFTWVAGRMADRTAAQTAGRSADTE